MKWFEIFFKILKKTLSEKDKEKKYYSKSSFFFLSFSDCNLANSNSSFVCLNFFNLIVCCNVSIKTAVFSTKNISK
jgi:hypothetical protein